MWASFKAVHSYVGSHCQSRLTKTTLTAALELKLWVILMLPQNLTVYIHLLPSLEGIYICASSLLLDEVLMTSIHSKNTNNNASNGDVCQVHLVHSLAYSLQKVWMTSYVNNFLTAGSPYLL
jgi:hypothetical protein